MNYVGPWSIVNWSHLRQLWRAKPREAIKGGRDDSIEDHENEANEGYLLVKKRGDAMIIASI